ncbi:hypothetical protein [Oerskovia turbata]
MSQTTTVLVELAADAADVERPVTAETLPPLPPRTGWRRWAWIVPTVPTAVLVAYQQLAPSRGWPLPAAVLGALMILLLLVAVLALARYLDDRDAQRETRARGALLTDAERTTGSVLVDAPGDTTGSTPDDAARVSGRVTFSADHLPVRAPFTTTVPTGARGPRSGDPVAVWLPAGTDGRPRVALVRYQRDWADDLLAAMSPQPADDQPRSATDAAPSGAAEEAEPPVDHQEFLLDLGRAGAEHPRLAAEVVAPTDAWRTVRVDLSLPGSVRSVLVYEDDDEVTLVGPDGGRPVPLGTLDPAHVLDLAERILRGE